VRYSGGGRGYEKNSEDSFVLFGDIGRNNDEIFD
jgi:hypothetical protein